MSSSLKPIWRAGVIFSLVAAAGISQTGSNSPVPAVVAGGQVDAFTRGGGALGVSTSRSPFDPVTGAPYSAAEVTERVQTLADGTHIDEKVQTSKMYRDSAGRTRIEHGFPSASAAVPMRPVFIRITDPVAGYSYTLNQGSHVARGIVWPPAIHRGQGSFGMPQTARAAVEQSAAVSSASQAAANQTEPPHPETVREDLGTQTIEGVVAQGMRLTTTYPAGFMSNNRPITTISETWRSTELRLIVLSKTTDPRSGESTTKLTNISLIEPDASLFQLPPGCTIEDAPQAVIIR